LLATEMAGFSRVANEPGLAQSKLIHEVKEYYICAQ
jgi:hypothetical protein